MKGYRVVYELDESGKWIATVPQVKGCHSYGRSINEARERIREALGLFVEDAAQVALVDHIRIPSDARIAVARLLAARARAARAAAAEAQARKAAVLKLTRSVRLSTRDVAEVVGLSHQRVQQLTSAARSNR
jgi:predicted RNase H-like HicB family nuclease